MLTEEIQQLENSYQRKNKFIVSLKRELREKDNQNKMLKKQLQDATNGNDSNT